MSEMAVLQAKSQVLEACKQLVSKNLVARTWGNISYRINEKYFVITPSGKSYHLLRHEDLVVVDIFNLSYEGNIKPSSEKGIHAEVYKKFNNINCVIHTHQCYATAFSVYSQKLINTLYDNICKLKISKYGLPGTKKLRKNVSKNIDKNSLILLQNHGVLVYDNTLDLAFKKALFLEEICKECFIKFYRYMPENTTIQEYKRKDFSNISKKHYLDLLCKSIFELNSNINIIGSINNNLIKEFSNKKYIPILDDFAQMFGVCVYSINKRDVIRKKYIRGKNALFVNNDCILCFAKDKNELDAQLKLIEKELITAKNAKRYNIKCRLSFFDRVIMRFVYIKKYSKLK